MSVYKHSLSRDYKKIVSEIDTNGRKEKENAKLDGGVNGEVDKLRNSLKQVYTVVHDNPDIRTKQIAELLNRSKSTVEKQLATLRKKNLIEYRGSSKSGGYYAIAGESYL